jgi:hypothetical protein
VQHQRYEIPEKYAPWGILAGMLMAVYQAAAPVQVKQSAESIRIQLGLYDSRNVSVDRLREVRLIAELPALGRRLSGYEFGPRRRARYELADGGTVDLFLERRQPPYLLLRADYVEPYTMIVNLWTASGTREACDLVQRAVAEGWPPRSERGR